MTKKRDKSNRAPVTEISTEEDKGKKYPPKEFYVFPAKPLEYPFPWMNPNYVKREIKHVPRKRDEINE